MIQGNIKLGEGVLSMLWECESSPAKSSRKLGQLGRLLGEAFPLHNPGYWMCSDNNLMVTGHLDFYYKNITVLEMEMRKNILF